MYYKSLFTLTIKVSEDRLYWKYKLKQIPSANQEDEIRQPAANSSFLLYNLVLKLQE